MAKSFRFPRWVEKTRTYSIHPVAFIDQPVATPHQPRYAQQLFDFGMIATGNHNFERFAALCNTPGGSQGGFAARVARLATPTMAVLRRERFVPPPPVWRAVSSPGGLRKQRIDTSPVRHYPAASPQRVARLATPTGLRSFRFLSCIEPGGLGHQRIGTISVRH